jgi:hypothetical protein
MITSQYAAGNNLMLHKNAKDLSAYVFIGCHFMVQLHRMNFVITISRSPAEEFSNVRYRKKCSTNDHDWRHPRALFHDSAFLNSPVDKPMREAVSVMPDL